MRDRHRLALVLLTAALAANCAARIPPSDTFRAEDWARVEALKPGARVEVRYVTGNPPLRHRFEGTFVHAGPDSLEIVTRDGAQRLLSQRVLRVAVGGRENRVAPLTIFGGLLGVLVGTVLTIDPPNDAVLRRKIKLGAAIGAVVGLSTGMRRGDARPLVVYSRSGSL